MANNGYRTIVIVGGDGALNDAINGIMLSDAEDKENIALGMIPNGIGNDFAKYWGLSTEYKPAVDCIINHRLKKIDVGYCNFYDGNEHQRRYFLNAVNIGLGARIVKITDQTKRFWGVIKKLAGILKRQKELCLFGQKFLAYIKSQLILLMIYLSKPVFYLFLVVLSAAKEKDILELL